MQTIKTKYHGPTDKRGTRIIARASGGYDQRHATSIVHNYDHIYDAEDNHRLAAEKLLKALRWQGEMIGGSLPDGYIWVFAGKCSPKIGEPVPAKNDPLKEAHIKIESLKKEKNMILEEKIAERERLRAERNELSAMLLAAVGGADNLEAFIYSWNARKNSEGGCNDE